MTITMDSAGRIIIPKSMRDELHLKSGQPLELQIRDNHLELSIAPTSVTLERRDGVLVGVPETSLPPLTAEQVRATLEQTRR